MEYRANWIGSFTAKLIIPSTCEWVLCFVFFSFSNRNHPTARIVWVQEAAVLSGVCGSLSWAYHSLSLWMWARTAQPLGSCLQPFSRHFRGFTDTVEFGPLWGHYKLPQHDGGKHRFLNLCLRVLRTWSAKAIARESDLGFRTPLRTCSSYTSFCFLIIARTIPRELP